MPNLYIPQSELRVHPYNISQEEANEKYLEILQDLTRRVIDNECYQSFDKEGASPNFVEYKTDGTGKDTVFVPTGKRLLTLNKIRIYEGAGDYDEIDADSFFAAEKYVSYLTYGGVGVSARYGEGSFPEGVRNVGIVGEWGWASVPEPIKYLQGKMIMRILREGSLNQKYRTEAIGDYSYEIKELQNDILGDPEMDMIIQEYRHWSFYNVI